MTFAAAEGKIEGGLMVAALHSVPSPASYGNLNDQWWSLGLEYLEDGMELALYSGPVASNGTNAIIKGHQRKFHDYDEAWIDLPAGTTVEKTFFVEARAVAERGSGFQLPLWTSVRLANPFNPDGFPPLKEVIARKFADSLDVKYILEDFFEDEEEGNRNPYGFFFFDPYSRSRGDDPKKLSQRAPLKFIDDPATNSIVVQNADADQLQSVRF